MEGADTGTYRVVVTNAFDSFDSGPVGLALYPAAPTFTLQPASRTARTGATVQLTAAARGDSPPRFQWIFKGKSIRGATNATLTLSNVAVKASGAYRVIATNMFGATTSSVANVIVFIPVSIKVQPKNLTARAGAKATFKVTAAGTKPAYQWRFNGVVIAGTTNASLVFAHVLPAQAGNYSVFISNAVSSLTSTVAVLTVTAAKARVEPSPLSGIDPAAGSVLTAVKLPNGEFTLTINGPRGRSHVIEASADLLEWTRIGVITNDTGTVEFIDREAGRLPHRFYRLVAP